MNTLEIAHKGLSESPKKLNHTFLYNDETGDLVDKAQNEPGFYIYHNDLAALVDNAGRIAEVAGKNRTLIELCCGLCEKSVPLLEALEDVQQFVGVDVDKGVLKVAERDLKEKFPNIKIETMPGDVFKPLDLPGDRKIGLMACSFVGIFTDEETVQLLKVCFQSLGEDGAILASYDTNQNPDVLIPTYSTPGFTAFMLNLLKVLNQDYGMNFNVSAFDYCPTWNAEKSQLEHNLVAKSRQVVTLDGKEYVFEEGEKLFVYQTRKRSVEQFGELVRKAGGVLKHNFFDKDHYLCFSWLEKEKH